MPNPTTKPRTFCRGTPNVLNARRSSVIGLLSAVFRLPPLLSESPATLAGLFLAGRCAQLSHLARAPAISLRNGHSGGEGLHARRPALLPQADGSGRFYHSGLPQGESRHAFSRVPLRAGQPGAITIGVPFGVRALSSLNTGFGDLEIWWSRFRRKKPAPFFHERSTACRSPWIR